MVNIDYLSDLGLLGGGSSPSSSNFNIVIDYVTDSSVEIGDLLTFVAGNRVKKAGSLDLINCIALEDGVTGATIKCQLYGVISIPNHFVSGASYYNNNGVLSTTKGDEYIGFAITESELLLKEGVFIHA